MLLKIFNNQKGSNEYTFNVESISRFKELDLDSKITIFTGANGSGKSSLLTIIKTISESIDIGNSLPVEESDQEAIINNFKCTRRIKHRNGFYL